MDITVTLMNLFFSNRGFFDSFYAGISSKDKDLIKSFILVDSEMANRLEKNDEIVVRDFLNLDYVWCKK